MYWANLLHFYQPYGQKREIVDAITEQCYRPVVEGILADPEARLTINFTGVLLDQLAEYGHQDVIDLYAEAAKRGRVEFVSSAKYHVILPLVPEAEARRQIQIHDETSRRHLGEAYQPKGVFLPEMAWRPELAPMLEDLGFEWVMLDELAYAGRVDQVDYSKLYEIAGTKLKAFFREHRLSATIMSAGPRDTGALKEVAKAELSERRAIITAMDGETFGHHRVGHEQLLLAMFADPDITLVRMSELLEKFDEVETVKTVACTWASSEDDIARGIQFISWSDPDNPLHRLQWELIELAVREVEGWSETEAGYHEARVRLDRALASDQLFWAAARPWWMIEHIEAGAHYVLEVLRLLPKERRETTRRGHELYRQILELAYEMQRSGRIEQMIGAARDAIVRVPLKERTLERGGPEAAAWQAYVEVMKAEEQAAAARGDYEAAILWRDGLYKFEHKLDVYDAMYAADLLKSKLARAGIEAKLAEYRAEYNRIRGGQVEQRSN